MADDKEPIVMECRDLILASVVHACQDHASRVRYYSAESLMNIVKSKLVSSCNWRANLMIVSKSYPGPGGRTFLHPLRGASKSLR